MIHGFSHGFSHGFFPFSQGKTGKTAGLLLQTLTTNGTLPVTLSAVETWAPGRTPFRFEALWDGKTMGKSRKKT
jgi:hypothetical protein